MNETQEMEHWRASRELAQRYDILKNNPDLDCVRDPSIFELTETLRRAKKLAMELCADCAVRDLCLERALVQEAGLRPKDRFGVAGGLDATGRYKLARERGCTICGGDLPPNGSGLFCGAHAARGARELAVRFGAA